MNGFLFKQIFQFLGWQVLWPIHHSMIRKDPFTRAFLLDVLLGPVAKVSSDILRIKKQALSSNERITIDDFGAGSKKMGNTRKVSDIARLSASNKKKGSLLYNMVQLYKPTVVFELGTSLGFGAMYMGAASSETHVISVEGSKVLSDLASKNIAQLGLTNIDLVNGKFEDVLPDLFQQHNGCDMFFVDGNHTKEATLQYFSMFLPYTKAGSVVIFDDIRWSEGMYEAWSEIRKHEAVKISIDLFSVGIVFFEQVDRKQHFRICY